MGKTTIYTILVALGFLIIIFLILNPGNFLKVGQSGIQISDTTSVSRIEIYGRDTIFLVRKVPGQWILNGKYKANLISVHNFLFCFQKMTIRGISKNLELNDHDTSSVRIKIFAGKRKYFFRFYPANGNNLLHREGSKKIYSVELSGADADKLSKVFSDNPDNWRDRTIIDLLPDEIFMVKVLHPHSLNEDFVIRMENKIPLLFESDGKTRIPDQIVDHEKLLMYVSYFINIFYDYSIQDDLPAGYSFAESPDYIITIIPVSADSVKMAVFKFFKDNKVDIFKAGIKLNDNPQILVTRYIAIDLILRKKSDFFKR